MQDSQRSISFRELLWDDVDRFANSIGFKDRSPFIEYCVAKELHKKKLSNFYNFFLILILALIMVLLILINMRI